MSDASKGGTMSSSGLHRQGPWLAHHQASALLLACDYQAEIAGGAGFSVLQLKKEIVRDNRTKRSREGAKSEPPSGVEPLTC